MSKVLVIGERCTDVFIYGTTPRKSPEGNGPVFIPAHTVSSDGMAMNTANNLAAMGVNVDVYTDLGDIKKTRYINTDTNELYLRVDDNDKTQRINISNLPELTKYDAIVISDYCKGFLTEDDISIISSMHNLVIVDTKKMLGEWCKNVKFIKINRLEFENSKEVIKKNYWLFRKIIFTLDKDGAVYQDRLYPTNQVENADVSGAGDTFVAGFVSKYIETNDISNSIKWANFCATRVVMEKGVTVFKMSE